MAFMMNVKKNMELRLYGNNLVMFLLIYHWLQQLIHKYFACMVGYHQIYKHWIKLDKSIGLF